MATEVLRGAGFDPQPSLAGETLDIRPLRAGDWDALYAAGSDPLVWAAHPEPDRWTRPKFRIYFEEALASGGAMAIVDRAAGAAIGSSRFSTAFTEPGEIEIGWTFLARSAWGGPANREAKRLMLTHAFGAVDRVIFRIGSENARSRRALEKIGGAPTGREDLAELSGVRFVYVYYVVTPEAFAAMG